ncbi:MAG TPA: hypothetical protein VIC34_02420, partial [Croceibacterium sp.]
MATAPGFEPLSRARYSVETIDGTDWIVTRPRRKWFAIVFFGGVLAVWGSVGISAIAATAQIDGFVITWVVLWASAMAFAASIVGWQLTGRAMVSVQDGAVVSRWQMPLVTRTRRYDAGQVRHLRPAPPFLPYVLFGNSTATLYPPWFATANGSVQFDYGARTVRVLPGLDEAEGR